MFKKMLLPIQRNSLINQAATTIHNYIIDQAMKPGDALPSERELASGLLISRVTLRNALAILEGQGVIVRGRTGAAVVASTISMQHVGNPAKLWTEIQQLWDLRLAAEVGAAEFACRRRTEDDLTRLRRIMDAWDKDNRAGHGVLGQDAEFHFALLQCAGESFFQTFGEMVRRYFRLASALKPRRMLAEVQPEEILADHLRIIDALEARDANSLRRLLIESQHGPLALAAPINSQPRETALSGSGTTT